MVIRYRHCFQQKIHFITQYWQKIEKTDCKIKHYLEISKLSNQKYVYENNISQTKLLVKDMQAAYKQGTALKSDITRYEQQHCITSTGLELHYG